ncbi:MAG: hypothetical protein ACE5HP_09230 [Gemmatimonadota bacterium]
MERNGDSSRSLPCEQVRRLLWPRELPRSHTDSEDAARRHLEECEACQAFFRRDEQIARVIWKHGRASRAPKGLRERVYDALAQERALGPSRATSRGAGWGRRGIIGLGAVALGLVAFFGSELIGTRGDADVYVQDFASRAVEEHTIETDDPSQAARFFLRELGIHVVPVRLENGRLSRAMICLIRGERSAMVEYEWEGHTVAHYRRPVGPGQNATASGRLWALEERGIHVVRWEDGRFENALVSELPGEDLVRLARSAFQGF